MKPLLLAFTAILILTGCSRQDHSQTVSPEAAASIAASAAAEAAQAQASKDAAAAQASEEAAAQASQDAAAAQAAAGAEAQQTALNACKRWEVGFNSVSPKSGRAYTEASIMANDAANGDNKYASLVQEMKDAWDAKQMLTAAMQPDAYGYVDYSQVDPLVGASAARNVQVARTCAGLGYTIRDTDGSALWDGR